MVKKLTLYEAEQKLQNKFNKDNITLLEYNGSGKSCRIKCNDCETIKTYAQFGNVMNLNRKYYCLQCYQPKQRKEQFFKQLQEKFPNEHFEIKEYGKNSKDPCTVLCLTCGNEQTLEHAQSFLDKKHLCPVCYPIRYKDIQKSIEKFKQYIDESEEWELITTDFSNIHSHDKVECKCKKCGSVNKKTIYTYLKGIHCLECSGRKKKTTEEFKQELDDDYTLLSDYDGNKVKVLLRHETCGFCYKVTPSDYIQGKRCPKCSRKQSKGEKRIEQFLINKEIEYISEFPVKIEGHNLRFDFYLPYFDKYIEFQGQQHYEPYGFGQRYEAFQKQVENDNRKRKAFSNKIIEIPYYDFDNIEEILTKELNL